MSRNHAAMLRIPWRILLVTLAVWLATFFVCIGIWGQARRRATTSVDLTLLHFSETWPSCDDMTAHYVEEKLPAPSVANKWIDWVRGLFGSKVAARPKSRVGIRVSRSYDGAEMAFFEGATSAVFPGERGTIALLNADGSRELWDLPLVFSKRLSLAAGGAVALLVFITGCLWSRDKQENDS